MYDLCIIGTGPGGFAAAIHAANNDLKVCLIESQDLGGICLNAGCIPTKTLLHTAKIISNAKTSHERGISFGDLKIDLAKAISHKNQVLDILRKQMSSYLKMKKIELLEGEAELLSKNEVSVNGRKLEAKHIIIAIGSNPVELRDLECESGKLIFSKDALNLTEIPRRLLIVGAGYIGCEFASAFSVLGSDVTVVEAMDKILPMEEADISSRLSKALEEKGIRILTGTYASKLDLNSFDKILLCVGRKPNINLKGLSSAGVKAGGQIEVDEYLKTSVDNIFAIGDCIGAPLLAHVAAYEARVAVDNILGRKRKADYSIVPSCIYTEPQVASIGMKQDQAKNKAIECYTKKFMFSGLGKAQAISETQGLIKILIEKKTDKIIGASIIGPEATEIIASLTVAIKADMTAGELKEVIYAHPTLSEIISESLHI